MNNPEFQIYQSTVNYQFYYHLNARNSEIILRGEGYTTKQGCQNGINSVKQNAPYDSSYDRKTANDGTFYITSKAPKGEIIGVSEMYNT
ncbi:MAG: YegP family protein [Bacteroidales bacterium]